MDKIDESCWPIGGSEWHNCILPLDCVNTLECELLLTLWGYCQLMISHRHIKHPMPPSLLRLIMNGQIAAWNRVWDELGDRIERNEIHTEAPDKFINTADVLLVWLCCKERFKEPLTICGLNNVSYLGYGHNALMHNDCLAFTVQDFLDWDGSCSSCVDDAFIILDWNKHTLLIKNRPFFWIMP